MRKRISKNVERKSNKELAEYLAFINPHKKEMYYAIAEFLGEDEECFKKSNP